MTKEPHFTQEQRIYIEEMRKTLRSEFESTSAEIAQRRKTTLEEVTDLKQDALQSLQHTLRHSDNESIKSKVAMWTIDTILDAQRSGDDPMAKFLKGLPQTEHLPQTEPVTQ